MAPRTLPWPLGEAPEPWRRGHGWAAGQGGRGRRKDARDLVWRRRSGVGFWAVVFANVMRGVGGSILGSGLFSLAGILESEHPRAGRCFVTQPSRSAPGGEALWTAPQRREGASEHLHPSPCLRPSLPSGRCQARLETHAQRFCGAGPAFRPIGLLNLEETREPL